MPEHPFYTRKGWMAAGDLWLDNPTRRSWLALVHRPNAVKWWAGIRGQGSVVRGVWRTALRLRGDTQVMYNLTVAEAHTFFVGDGQWLVHNSCLEQIQQNVSNTMRPISIQSRALLLMPRSDLEGHWIAERKVRTKTISRLIQQVLMLMRYIQINNLDVL